MDVAEVVPEGTQLEGIDIDGTLFPETYPSNVHFSIGSIVSLPEDWAERIDLVHQRLLVGSLQSNEWKATILESYRILKQEDTQCWLKSGRNGPKGRD